ncbi:NADP-dependent oxidoreductase [Parvularcula oceani]|uniref:NADP-dependent oxidoreductase n=1 Tax=Parvularcula oceani TaxID=1247963 RepID=UPI0004E265C1|nr:NADP-dependent oxidoreductase [Parvularcula oceani]
MTTSRQIQLKGYPDGAPTPDLFQEATVELPAPQDGQALVETLYMSVDPYMRGRMNPHVKSYIPPFQLNEPLDGGAVCRVLESKTPELSEGDIVVGMGGAGWRSHAIITPKGFSKIDPDLVPLPAYLGVLGMPGLTAWAGLTQIIKPKEGETLYVSGAAGAVGSLVCQLGKHYGMTVLGSAGSQEKLDWLVREAGVDHAFNYKEHDARSLTKAIAEVAPKGVDGYFENVGGMQLEALLNVIAFGGRIAACGMIANYNAKELPPGPSSIINIIPRGVLMQGFIVSNYAHLQDDFIKEVAPLVASGKIKHEETIYDGLEKAPEAFLGLFEGANTGKAVVKVGA